MENNDFEEYESLFNKLESYDKSLKTIDKEFFYGTSGFRYELCYRVALGLYLKSIEFNGIPLGLMITASHNKYHDNGFKVAAFNGESVPSSWEKYFKDIVNAKNLIEFMKYSLLDIVRNTNKNIKSLLSTKALICYAYDTRPSSKEFDLIIKETLNNLNCDYTCYDIITTPGLHYLTLLNQLKFEKLSNEGICPFEFCKEQEYWDFLRSSYNNLEKYVEGSKTFIKNHHSNVSNNNTMEIDDKYEKKILFDCANGISAFVKDKIKNIFADDQEINVEFINYDYENYKFLNEGCGAEHVQKEKKLPDNYINNLKFMKNISFDGDVDRIVYFSFDSANNALKIIDGDYQACLFAKFINSIIENLSQKIRVKFLEQISLAIITTAYSNGGFMNYIQKEINDIKLILAKTGVKNLHRKALNFEIAIYFEANGHGTIYHKEEALKKILEELKNTDDVTENDEKIFDLLSIFLKSFNKTVGDSLSVVLCAEKCLKIMNMKCVEICDLYDIIPSVNLKKIVKDKNFYISNDDDSALLEPQDIQKSIDEIVSQYKNERGRCFVRASGTEDIVRIYSEAVTQEIAEDIAHRVYEILY